MPRLDRTTGVPAYRQLAEQLRSQIRDGTYQPGHQLPSERELSERYETSRLTVRQAIAELRSEGLITAEHGRGLFVRKPSPVQRLTRSRLSSAESHTSDDAVTATEVRIEVRRQVADDRTAQLLHLEVGDVVVTRDCLVLAGGQPVQLAVSNLPAELAGGTRIEDTDAGPEDIPACLEALGHSPHWSGETVSARMPTPSEASALQLTGGIPVLLVTRTIYDSTGRPIQTDDTVLAANRHELYYELRAEDLGT